MAKKISYILISTLVFIYSITGQTKIDVNLVWNTEIEQDYIVALKSDDLALPDFLTKNEKGDKIFNHLVLEQKKQKSLINFLQNKKLYFETFYIINAIRVKSDYNTMMQISTRSDVHFITKNINLSYAPIVREGESSRDPMPEWGIAKIQADSVWKLGITGQGVIVGGEDTGYEWTVSPLQKKYKGYINPNTVNHNYNWHDAIHEKSPLNTDSLNPCGYNTKVPCDDDDHGTHTMGTMVGQDSSNAIGVAPGAKWIGCRNMERGWGKLSTYLECFQWFLAPTDLNNLNPDPKQAPHVINNSWYCSEEEGCNITNWSALEMAVNNLKKAGIVVVVSAGNDGPNCNTIRYSPALFSNSFSVGATDMADNIASFSSRGNVIVDSSYRIKPDVAAPGRQVRSVTRGGIFKTFNGTSMAGPHAAGLVALIISANPSLAGQVDLIQNIIRKSADPMTTTQVCSNIPGTTIPNPVFGFGRINALKSIHLAKTTTISTVTTIDNLDKVLIYPNPIANEVIIELPSTLRIAQYQLFNTTGMALGKGMIEEKIRLDLSTTSPGIYFLKLETNGAEKIYKLIRQ